MPRSKRAFTSASASCRITLLHELAPLLCGLVFAGAAWGQPVTPGSGVQLHQVGDDFESSDPWNFALQLPKSSREMDKKERGPLGQSDNGRWLEGPHRGTPDVVRRAPTPPGGLPDSRQALLLRTLHPGIPGRLTRKPQQDDLMVTVHQRLGSPLPAAQAPSCVVRVFVPEFHEWEQRSGASFGFRTDAWGTRGSSRELTQYWPGMMINFRHAAGRGGGGPVAFLTLRANQQGQDVRGPEITPGWWTLGMSIGPDGQCHFYARQGVDDLQASDHLASYYCYGYRAQRLDLMFFNIVTLDDGQHWSTPWIIDDPAVFVWPQAAGAAAHSPLSGRRR